MTEFKVGERVRVIKENLACFGQEGSILSVLNVLPPYEVKLDSGCCVNLLSDEIEKLEEDVTQEYEVGKPYLWFGGECPVPPRTKVKIRFGKADLSEINKHWHREVFAGEAIWHHEFSVMNIVMFEVVEYPKQTRKVELELTEEEINTIKNVLGKANL